MRDRSENFKPDDNQPMLFNFSEPEPGLAPEPPAARREPETVTPNPVPELHDVLSEPALEPRAWGREVWRFILTWRLQFGIGLALAVIGWVWLRPSVQAQSSPPSRSETAKPSVVSEPPAIPREITPAIAVEPKTTATPPPSQPATPPKFAGQPKITWSSATIDAPSIAMTFDDGPHATNTPKLLAMLKQRNIKATFFLVGECAKQYPEIVKRIVAEGHEIANHSWSHPNLAKLSDEALRSQLQRTQDAIVAACGVKPAIMRPPYGELTSRQRQWVNAEFGYKIILWDVDPLDWKIRNADHVAHEIIGHTHNGSIILSHDIHATTVAAMPETLDALLAKGFHFVKVSELLALEKSSTSVEPSAPPVVAEPPAKPAPKKSPKRRK